MNNIPISILYLICLKKKKKKKKKKGKKVNIFAENLKTLEPLEIKKSEIL